MKMGISSISTWLMKSIHMTFIMFYNRNTKKCEDKVEEMTTDIAETKLKEQQLMEDYKKVEADASAVMAEYEKLQVVNIFMHKEIQ